MATALELSLYDIQGLCQQYCNEKQLLEAPDAKDEESKGQSTKVKVISYKLKPTSDAPSGFLGHHRFLKVEISLENGENSKRIEKLRFFTKSAPVEIESRMQYLEEFGVFKKEILVYRNILPRIEKIFAQIAPKCYYADNNILVFENLSEQGYQMAAGRDGLLNYEHLQCALKTLADLHAGSIVYETKNGCKLLDLYPEALQENAYPQNLPAEHVRIQNFNNGVLVFKEIIKSIPKYQDRLEYILAELPERMQKIFELANVSGKYQNVVSHGDLWANNVMFQYGKFGEMPIQARFVDFQLARYGPPMLDLLTLLTIPSSREFREKYLAELLNDYYRFMTDFLKLANLRIEDFKGLTRPEFDAACEEFRICGLIESCLFSHLTILPSRLTQSLTGSADGFSDFFNRRRVEICMEAFRSDETYRQRLSDMLEDFVDNYVLKSK